MIECKGRLNQVGLSTVKYVNDFNNMVFLCKGTYWWNEALIGNDYIGNPRPCCVPQSSHSHGMATTGIHLKHNGTANCWFADGHVVARRAQEEAD